MKEKFQLIWGLILIISGISVFIRLPYVISRVENINYFIFSMNYIKFCFYLIGIFLIFGGIRKIYITLKN